MTPRDLADALPPGQQLAAEHKWPVVGQQASLPWDGPWRLDLRVEGESLASYTLDELQRLPHREHVIDVHCVTRWSKPRMRFTGVLLADLLTDLDTSQAKFVSFIAHSEGDHSTSLPLSSALDLPVILAWSAEGESLSPEHGGPLRSVAPARYFYKSLKWLRAIDLLAIDRLGYWEAEAGYHNEADPWQEQRFIAAGLTRRQAEDFVLRRDVSGQSLLSAQMAKRDLSGLNAQGALLRNAEFTAANLSDANFSHANLSNARFIAANLVGATFCHADLEGADFTAADLRGTDLAGASLFGASFTGTGGQPGARIDATTRIDAESIEVLTPAQASYVNACRP